MQDWKTKCAAFLADESVPQKAKDRSQESSEIVAEAMKNYKPEELAMSFNGGKDCLVMLIVILAVCPKLPQYSIYIRTPNSFKEVDDFVDHCASKYGLMLSTSALPMKEALQHYSDENPKIKAVFVGIRRADPWASDLTFFQTTDHGWPDFMRIHPILDWEYDDIWTFLRHSHVDYCQLYDLGYTSLGSIPTTVRNPSLKRDDGTYRPAYESSDPTSERIGRLPSKKT